MDLLSGFMRQLFSSCLRQGCFPPAWEQANLVLIPKGGRPEVTPSAYRPICLLDEAGKMLERVIADCLAQHLRMEGPDLHEEQYGFREGRSTTDAILRVGSFVESEIEEGRVVVAVSLDIVNAFNTLPWVKVGDALAYHRVPQYLVEIIGSYFENRGLRYQDKTGTDCGRQMYCGVPQGSVLGPLLWDLAYDRVLRSALPPAAGSSVMQTTLWFWPGGIAGEKQRERRKWRWHAPCAR